MTKKTSTTSQRAKRIAEEKRDIRARMHELMRDAINEGKFGVDEVREFTSEALDGIRAGFGKAVPKDRNHVLHQAFDGMADAVGAGAKSAKKAMGNLQSLEESFFDAVGKAARAMSDESGEFLEDLVNRTRRAGAKMEPAVRHAVDTAKKRGPELARESVKAGGRAMTGLASEFALGMSGLLSGLGSALGKGSIETPGSKKGPGKSSKQSGGSKMNVNSKSKGPSSMPKRSQGR